LTAAACDKLCNLSPFMEKKQYGPRAITSCCGSIVIDSSSSTYIKDLAPSVQSTDNRPSFYSTVPLLSLSFYNITISMYVLLHTTVISADTTFHRFTTHRKLRIPRTLKVSTLEFCRLYFMHSLDSYIQQRWRP
jgi:hypothetical protein